jgi:N-acetylglucosaminyldiphosphoundecaprenol N-acetyl-beta-D-mannosaminyltransferase
MIDDVKSYRILGFKITPVTVTDILRGVEESIDSDKRIVVASQNLHGVYVHLTSDHFRGLHESKDTLVHIDGMPLVWVARLLGITLRQEHRTAVLDWFMPLLELASKSGWRVYYLGSTPEVLDQGMARIRESRPDLELKGHHGFFDLTKDGPENAKILAEIEEFGPNIILTGMGMGRQERWIVENRSDLKANCIMTTGACMELIAGILPVAPRWTSLMGLEWLYRLVTTPRRVARRYLLEPWLIAWLLLTDWFRTRRVH